MKSAHIVLENQAHTKLRFMLAMRIFLRTLIHFMNIKKWRS